MCVWHFIYLSNYNMIAKNVIHYNIQMHSSLLSSSRFGKFYPRSHQNQRTIELTTPDVLCSVNFTITGEKLYVLDRSGNLTCLTLRDNSVSTFSSIKLSQYQIDTNNPYSVYAVSNKSQLYHISFQNKKSTKIMSLNIGRVLSFQKNHFTNLMLIVEFQIIMIFDLNPNSSNKIRSIKASNGDTFSGGQFLNQNRFIIVVVKTNKLRVIQVMGMKVVYEILLPFQLKGVKLQPSIDGSALAIYGESNKLLIAHVSKNGNLTYQTVQLPIQSILQLKFTHNNDIIFLANNRILYAITPTNRNRLVELFNYQQQIRFSSFDIALDARSISLIANKTVHLLTYNKGIRKHLQDFQGGVHIEFNEQEAGNNKIDRQIQYQDEDEHQLNKVHKQISQNLSAPNLPQFKQPQEGEIIAEINNLKVPPSSKITINTIYTYLHQFQPSRAIVHLHKTQVVQFINQLLSLIKNPKQSAAVAYHILTLLGTSIKDSSLQKYALILAPRIFERIQKYEGQFIDFIKKSVLNLFKDYIEQQKSYQMIQIILNNRKRQSFLPIFIISLLLQMRTNSQSWPFPHIQNIDFDEVLIETENLMSNPQQAYIFAKEINEEHHPIQKQKSEGLEILLRRQQELKKSLENIRSTYV